MSQNRAKVSEKFQEHINRKRRRTQTGQDTQRQYKQTTISRVATRIVGYGQLQQTYKPLQNVVDGFRLFRFTRPTRNRTDNIACEVSEHCLSEPPTYLALSYEWGNAEDQACICVDGNPFRIRKNLYILLETLRSSVSSETWLFADAICVNQDDVNERDTQVRLMGHIYSTAQSVLAWIGPAADDSEELFRLYSKRSAVQQWTLHKTLIEIFRTSDLEVVTRALMCLQNRSYWDRLWIVQEILLARDVTIMCGTWAIPWSEFQIMLILPSFLRGIQDGLINTLSFRAFHAQSRHEAHDLASDILTEDQQYLLHSQSRRDAHIMAMDIFPEVHHCRLRSLVAHRYITSRSGLHLRIDEMIELYGQSSCSDIRDRVFGILGVIRANIKGCHLVPNYRKSGLNLFFDVMQCYWIPDMMRFAMTLNHSLQLKDIFLCATYKELTERVENCIHEPDCFQGLHIQLSYAGQVGTRRIPILQSETSKSCSLKSVTRNTNMYTVTGARNSTSDDYLFTSARVKKGDPIVRIGEYSEYVFLYRVRCFKRDEITFENRWKESSYLKIQLVGRGVLLAPDLAPEAATFLAKEFPFGTHKASEVQRVVQFGLETSISLNPVDMLIVTTTVDPRKKPRGEIKSDIQTSSRESRPFMAPTNHLSAFREMEKNGFCNKPPCFKPAECGRIQLRYARWNHRQSCMYEDCELKEPTTTYRMCPYSEDSATKH